MSNKILLIRPENTFNYNNYPPLNLINLATVLKNKGYDVEIINCVIEANSLKIIEGKLSDCLFIGITMLTPEVPHAYEIMKFVKSKSDTPIVVGGWHCTLFPEQMTACQYIDYVVVGEGEDHIVEIADKIRDNVPITNKLFENKWVDLEKLPCPDYSIDTNIERFIKEYLTDKLSEYAEGPIRWLPYDSSRGCPSLCTFCINVVTGNNTCWRKKSPEKVVSDLEHIIKEYNLTHVKIIDDNFFVSIKRVRKICQLMIDRNLNVTWDGECRCDYFNDRGLNDETLELAKKSGLNQLTLGLESGSQRTLNLMKKGMTIEQGEYAVKKCAEHGIIPRCSFIVEIPGETKDDIKQTIAFVKKLRKHERFTCGVQVFKPYPKCELTAQLVKEGSFYEPTSIEDWLDKGLIDLYVSNQYIRPWQVDGKFSEAAAYYLTMESGVSLRPHMIDNKIDLFKLRLFMDLAKARNRLNFYKFPIDKNLYKTFFARVFEDIKKKRMDGYDFPDI